MSIFTRLYVKVTERKGQAMAEYALIMAAVAVGGFIVYQKLGNQITTVLNTVIGDL